MIRKILFAAPVFIEGTPGSLWQVTDAKTLDRMATHAESHPSGIVANTTFVRLSDVLHILNANNQPKETQ